jgi:thiamine-phosphate pyrophosphorylase
VAAAVDVPVIAIGGVTADRVGELVAAGAAGVAVVEAVSGAPDSAAATRRLLRELARQR